MHSSEWILHRFYKTVYYPPTSFNLSGPSMGRNMYNTVNVSMKDEGMRYYSFTVQRYFITVPWRNELFSPATWEISLPSDCNLPLIQSVVA